MCGRDGVPAASGLLWLHYFAADDFLAAPDVAAVEGKETLALARGLLLLVADGLCLREGRFQLYGGYFYIVSGNAFGKAK